MGSWKKINEVQNVLVEIIRFFNSNLCLKNA